MQKQSITAIFRLLLKDGIKKPDSEWDSNPWTTEPRSSTSTILTTSLWHCLGPSIERTMCTSNFSRSSKVCGTKHLCVYRNNGDTFLRRWLFQHYAVPDPKWRFVRDVGVGGQELIRLDPVCQMPIPEVNPDGLSFLFRRTSSSA